MSTLLMLLKHDDILIWLPYLRSILKFNTSVFLHIVLINTIVISNLEFWPLLGLHVVVIYLFVWHNINILWMNLKIFNLITMCVYLLRVFMVKLIFFGLCSKVIQWVIHWVKLTLSSCSVWYDVIIYTFVIMYSTLNWTFFVFLWKTPLLL